MSLTFFVVIQQANNFEFSKLNIVDEHLHNEQQIAARSGNNLNGDKMFGMFKGAKDENGPWVRKCEYGVAPK